MRELKIKGQMVLGMDRHSVFLWDCRLPSASPASVVAYDKGIIDCLEFDGGNNVIFNTADEVKFFGIHELLFCTYI